MRFIMLIAAAATLAACSPRGDQKAACEAKGGVYHMSSDYDDDVCVFSRDPATKVQFFENE